MPHVERMDKALSLGSSDYRHKASFWKIVVEERKMDAIARCFITYGTCIRIQPLGHPIDEAFDHIRGPVPFLDQFFQIRIETSVVEADHIVRCSELLQDRFFMFKRVLITEFVKKLGVKVALRGYRHLGHLVQDPS